MTDWNAINFNTSYYNTAFNFAFFHELAHHRWWSQNGGPATNPQQAAEAEDYAQYWGNLCGSGGPLE
ncbi:MAG: hypothetical protein ACREMA_08210 [Longimicrobiales bacterium]